MLLHPVPEQADGHPSDRLPDAYGYSLAIGFCGEVQPGEFEVDLQPIGVEFLRLADDDALQVVREIGVWDASLVVRTAANKVLERLLVKHRVAQRHRDRDAL